MEALPYFIVHDAVYVPENKADEVLKVCKDAMKPHTGFEGRWETG